MHDSPTPLLMDGDLTQLQREVMDLVVDSRSNKEIGSLLGISKSAVDQRLLSARLKLGASSRAEAARLYRDQIASASCAKTPCAKHPWVKNQLTSPLLFDDLPAQDEEAEADLVLADSAPHWAQRWEAGPATHSLLETYDAWAGKNGRLAAVIGIALAFALLILIVLSVGNALDQAYLSRLPAQTPLQSGRENDHAHDRRNCPSASCSRDERSGTHA